MIKIKKIILITFIFALFCTLKVNSIENKILLKIDNEIITSIDVFKETKYLMAINEGIKEMSKKDIYMISFNSLLREKIRKIEILKNISDEDFDIDQEYLNQLVASTYKKLGFKKLEDFNDHLNKYEISIHRVKDRITTEALWNELIYQKFSNKVLIDKEKLKQKVIEDNNKITQSFSLSEIVFKISKEENINQKFNLIKKDINDKGFSNAVLLHSISNSANNNGDLGWIMEGSLNPKIKNRITNLEVNNYTKPITIPGGFLILKLNDKKEVQNKYDVKKKMDELIRIETNQQLNQLSNIYYDKVKKERMISEL